MMRIVSRLKQRVKGEEAMFMLNVVFEYNSFKVGPNQKAIERDHYAIPSPNDNIQCYSNIFII